MMTDDRYYDLILDVIREAKTTVHARGSGLKRAFSDQLEKSVELIEAETEVRQRELLYSQLTARSA